MQITLETDYAVRCLVYLKDHRDKVSVLGEISKTTMIPPAFLSKILQKMIKRDLVKSTQGKKGGFMLAKDPNRISVYNIMQAVCGCETVMKVVCSKTKEPCAFLKSCKIHVVWQDLGKIMRMILESRKLSQL
jgi:Rrf2 family protein